MFILAGNKTEKVKPVRRETIESVTDDFEINIIRRVKSGNGNAFEEIVERYKDKAFTLTMRILKNDEDAEDSLQDAFVKTYKAIMEEQFEERSKFSTYFYRIVYNTALDHYKKLKRNFNSVKIDAPVKYLENEETELNNFEVKIDKSFSGYDSNNLDKKAADNEIQNLVNNFVTQLPDKYSTILTMFFLNDLTHEEISQALRLPLGTVKNRIFRAKEKLKETIKAKYNVEDIVQYI